MKQAASNLAFGILLGAMLFSCFPENVFAAASAIMGQEKESDSPAIEYSEQTSAVPEKIELQEEDSKLSYPLTPAGSDEERRPHSNQPSGNLYFVSPRGSDHSAGSESSPWHSIQYAVDHLEPGDTLYVLAGDYKESVKLTTSGTERAWIHIQGVGPVVVDGTPNSNTNGESQSAFDTAGQAFIKLSNFEVLNAKAAVDINGGRYINIENLKSDNNGSAVRIRNANNIKVRNIYALNNRTAFLTLGKETRTVLFENIEAIGEKDLRHGGEKIEGSSSDRVGFDLEQGKNITLRNIAAVNYNGGGFDIRANNVTVENIVTFGNKKNFDVSGENIIIKNALVFGAKSAGSGGTENTTGIGINVRKGTLKIRNSTIVDNEALNLKMSEDSAVIVENSIISQMNTTGRLVEINGAYFRHDHNLWYSGEDAGISAEGFFMAHDEQWTRPGFENSLLRNFHLKKDSGQQGYGYKGAPEKLPMVRAKRNRTLSFPARIEIALPAYRPAYPAASRNAVHNLPSPLDSRS